MNRTLTLATCLVGVVIAGLLAGPLVTAQQVSLSPKNWPAGELPKYLELMQTIPAPNPLVSGRQGAITGTYNAPAMRAGFAALEQAGTRSMRR